MRDRWILGAFLAFSATGCMAAKSAAPPPGPIGPEGTPEKAAASAAPTTGAADNPIVPPAEKKPIEPERADADSKGDPADDEAGLGLSGAGNGGGGTGDGIGLGSISTIGRGAGSGKGQGYGSGGGSSDPLGSKKGRVAAATATTTGTGLANEVIARVVKGNIGAISKCYEKAMAKLPSLSGKVAVKFTIDAKGAVLSASPGDTNITDADMVSCVVGAVKGMTFPQPDGGGVVVVTYPFVFAPVDP